MDIWDSKNTLKLFTIQITGYEHYEKDTKFGDLMQNIIFENHKSEFYYK